MSALPPKPAPDASTPYGVPESLLMGDALFETLRIHGGRALYAGLHADRIVAAATDAGYRWTDLRRRFLDAVERGENEARARVGSGDAALRIVAYEDADTALRLHRSARAYAPPTDAVYRAGVRLAVSDLAHPGDGHRGKTTSRHWSRTAARRCPPGYEALVCNARGLVVETPTAAVVWRTGATWHRPPNALGALPGTTVAALRAAGTAFTETATTAAALANADAVVLLSALRLAIGVAALGERTWSAPDHDAERLRTILLGAPTTEGSMNEGRS